MNINITTKCIPTYDGIRNCWHHGMDEYGVSGFCRSIKNVSFKQEPATPEVALTQASSGADWWDNPPAAGSDLNRELRVAYRDNSYHPMLSELLQAYLSNGGWLQDYRSAAEEALFLNPRGPKGIPFGQHLTCSQCGIRCTHNHVHQSNGDIWCPRCMMKAANPGRLPQAPAGAGSEADERDPWINP